MRYALEIASSPPRPGQPHFPSGHPGSCLPGGPARRTRPGRLMLAALVLAAPLLAVPLIHVPLLRGVIRRRRWRFPRVVPASVFLTIPPAGWPVGVLSGALHDVRTGELRGVAKLARGLSTPQAQAFAPLYGTFGLLFGIWLARRD